MALNRAECKKAELDLCNQPQIVWIRLFAAAAATQNRPLRCKEESVIGVYGSH